MRTKLLTTVSASAIALGTLAGQPARADDDFTAPSGSDWYISLFGGGAIQESTHSFMGEVFDITTKDGFALGGAVGTELVPGLRAEAEITYLRQKTRNSTSSGGGGNFPIPGDTEAAIFLANLWKDIDLGALTSFYVGGGLGAALQDIKARQPGTNRRNWDDGGIALAGQLGAGFRVALTDQLSLDAGYRFKIAVDANMQNRNGTAPATLTMYNHVVQGGLNWSFHGAGQSQTATAGFLSGANWYASLFSGPVSGEDFPLMVEDTTYLVKNKSGFTIGGAVGTHLAPGLRAEIEASYIGSEARAATSGADREQASGGIDQVYVLANLWKDFQAGVISPYLGAGLGVGIIGFDGFRLNNDRLDSSGVGLAAQVGLGAKVTLTDALTLDSLFEKTAKES